MTAVKSKSRLDILLVERGLAPSRERARGLIMAGRVLVGGIKVEKPGAVVAHDAVLHLTGPEVPYVSRGGIKLKAALDSFNISPAGMRILDAGASTGGFTHCLLDCGAARVVAVDVGYGQLDWKLRNDPRVTVMERTNIRFLEPESLPHPVDAAVADLSFISLKLVLPQLNKLLPQGGWAVVLVKPQFEVGRGQVGKGGVVRDAEKIREAVEGIRRCARECGFLVLGEIESPITGPKGNREFLLHLQKQ